MSRRVTGEHGSAALLVLCGALVVFVLALRIMLVTAGIGSASARARTAGDAAALAAARAGCPAARDVAEANGAVLARCVLGSAGSTAVPAPAALVEVVVQPGDPVAAALAGPLHARAAAAVRRAPPGDAEASGAPSAAADSSPDLVADLAARPYACDVHVRNTPFPSARALLSWADDRLGLIGWADGLDRRGWR